MYKVKRIGCYNIDIEGDIWNNDNLYGIVRFSKFNDDEEEVEHKTIYFQILNDNAFFCIGLCLSSKQKSKFLIF